MKPVLLLIHPKHGIVERCEVNGGNSEKVIKETWRMLRGKKYLECTIELEEKKKQGPYKRPIYDIKTFEVYPTIAAAAKATGVRWSQVRDQLKRTDRITVRKRFKYFS